MPTPKPFEHLAREFTKVVDDFAKCQDKQKRKELLLAMRLILSEADRLSVDQLKGYPIPGSARK